VTIRTSGVERLSIFAVESSAIQVCWHRLTPGSHVLAVDPDGREVKVFGDGGPGAVRVERLSSGRRVRVRLAGAQAEAQLLEQPALEASVKIATVGDLHIGEAGFGYLPRLHDDRAEHSLRCTRAAIDEALEWGAELLVVKGDISHECRREEFEAAGELLSTVPVPVVVMPGNHDGGNHAGADPAACLRPYGIELMSGVRTIDLPNLRLIVASTLRLGSGRGDVRPVTEEIAAALRATPLASSALLVLHHHLHRTIVATHLPQGVVGPQAFRFLSAVEQARPHTLITSGHSHRNRGRHHRSLILSEVGSPKDYPGTWAGYVAYPDRLRQVVYRVADPPAIAWTERTGRALFGIWGLWSRGTLASRCFDVPLVQRVQR
jgi:predicted phosphodiesterase